jgi:uncharacterized paraquat-inducible protein A
MFTILIMLLLVIVAGWFDSRLDWQQANHQEQKEERS